MMDESNLFLNYDGLDAQQASYLRNLISPELHSQRVEFPWTDFEPQEKNKGASLNIHAPVFQSVQGGEALLNGDHKKVSTFKLNPTVSSFVPLHFSPPNGLIKETGDQKQGGSEEEEAPPPSQGGVGRSWADIVSRGQKAAGGTDNAAAATNKSTTELEPDVGLSVEEDRMALVLGKHLYDAKLNFTPLLLQARGLINRRNWCYINATLQALLACAPFYTLVRNLPLGPAVERGKSATPVTDSMVKLTYEFTRLPEGPQEEFQTGSPFQPDFIYDMLKDLKSDCLKGHQEDAEEFLSFILNGMHEEMVRIIQNYEKKNDLELPKENGGDASEGEEEWTVIGSKHRGMVTRKVAEHKTPISELLGGQMKSFLTTSGNKTSSASIQPFFTLQLDIQSDNVNSVSDALREMTVKEPIQGYTCAKTKQEVEAYSHIALQKLPPVLILHLKRFIYNQTGCKKVMKKTDYPLELELSKDMFSAELRKNQKFRKYKLFAVMYHDGEEAVKGHYISDVYSHGCRSWIRCDDRALTPVTEAQVLSHSPPRAPYLLFYQLL